MAQADLFELTTWRRRSCLSDGGSPPFFYGYEIYHSKCFKSFAYWHKKTPLNEVPFSKEASHAQGARGLKRSFRARCHAWHLAVRPTGELPRALSSCYISVFAIFIQKILPLGRIIHCPIIAVHKVSVCCQHEPFRMSFFVHTFQNDIVEIASINFFDHFIINGANKI